MHITPELFRPQYEKVFEWLEDKPCTRAKGLGTQFPWDKSKIIEPLADSTIYMAYFTISHLIKQIPAEKLIPEVFDYIFLGKGNEKKLQAKTKISPKLLKQMRKEFDYWYPLAYNVSAIELIPNHMSFSIFQHTAIFPPQKRQKGTLNLGMLVIEGEKMSSSKGNVILIGDIAQNIGADMARFFLMNFVEPWQEANWKQQDVEAGLKQLTHLLERFFELGPKVKAAKNLTKTKLSAADSWMLSRLHGHLKAGTDAVDHFELRKFLQEMTFQLMNDLKWYERRQSGMTPGKSAVYKHLLDIWTRALSPFMPHLCEELWHTALGNKTFLATEAWPKFEKRWLNPKADSAEALVMRLMTDARNVFQLVRVTPKKVTLFVAETWKYDLFKKLQKEVQKSREVGKILKRVMVKKYAQDISKIVPAIVKDPARLSAYILGQREELAILQEAKTFFEGEWAATVEVVKADGKEGKARQAVPGKPAILVE